MAFTIELVPLILELDIISSCEFDRILSSCELDRILSSCELDRILFVCSLCSIFGILWDSSINRRLKLNFTVGLIYLSIFSEFDKILYKLFQ